jgi:hypothetical protein
MANATYPVNSAGSAAFVTIVSAFVFAFLVPICNADGYVQPVIVAVLTGVFAEITRRRAIHKLAASRDSTAADALLDVYVNGANVGSIAAIDIFSLKLDALRDPRNYAAQLANIIGFSCRGALAAIVLLPLLLFWTCLISAWISPASFQTSMSMIVHLQPSDVSRAASQLLVLTQILFMLTIGASFGFGIDLGLSDVFRRAVHQRIRRKVNCASEGTLYFSPVARAHRPQPA